MKPFLIIPFFLAVSFLSKAQIHSSIENNTSEGNSFFSFEEGEGQVFWTDAVVHPEGYFTVAGTVLSGGRHYLALARFLPNGAPDCSFQQEGISELNIPVDWEYLIRLKRLDEGKLLVLFNPPLHEKAIFMARFLENGDPDPEFGENGILRVPIPKPVHFMDLLVQEDGGIVLAGFEENTQTGTHNCRVIRLLPNGQIDLSFNPQPPPPTPHSYHLIALSAAPGGKILLTAYMNGQLGVARLLPDGKKDPDFGGGECKFFPIPGFRPYDILSFPDSSWLVLGGGREGAQGYPIAVKGGKDGALDEDFGQYGVLFTEGHNIAAAGVAQSNGNWTFAGMGECEDKTSAFILGRFRSDGLPDPGFGDRGLVKPTFEVPCFQGSGIFLKALPGERILAGGTINFKGALVCLDEHGQPVASFGEQGTVISILGDSNPLDVDCTKVLSDGNGSLIATGTVVKPFDSEFLAIRVESDGALDPDFHQQGLATIDLPAPIVGVDAALQPDGKLVLGGRMRKAHNGAYDIDFAACRLNPDGSLDTSFAGKGYTTIDQGAYDMLGSVVLQPDGRILLAGDMENPETFERELAVFRLLPTGLPDPGFGAGGRVTLRHAPVGSFANLMVQQNGKILILDAHPPNEFDLIRLQADGNIDKGFGIDGIYEEAFTGTFYPLNSLLGAVTKDDHILIAGQLGYETHLTRLKEYGERDEDFGISGSVWYDLPRAISKMALLANDKILLAGSGPAENSPHYHFFTVLFTPDGQPDPDFGENGLVITQLPAFSFLSSLLPLDDGTIILGGKGYSSETDAHTDMVLVRYLPRLDVGNMCPEHQFPFLNVYPYPVETSAVELSYELHQKRDITITLHDPDGRELAVLLAICRPAGKYTESLQLPSNLPNGNYKVKVLTDLTETSIQFIYRAELR